MRNSKKIALAFAVVLLCGLSAGRADAYQEAWGGRPAYEVEVVVDGRPVREYSHEGRNYVLGTLGARYALRVRNNTGRRVEVVATVDGLDVIDGKAGDYVSKRGYILAPWQTYDIEGFRLDMRNVAAFRFSTVPQSYAARTGDARNVGVIGVAFFAERHPDPPPPPPRPVYPTWGAGDGDYRRGEATAAESAPADATWGFGGGGKAKKAPSAGAGALGRSSAYDDSDRGGLGTGFGEARTSRVRETTFVRASRSQPTRVVSVWYNDRAGLLAMGVPVEDPISWETWQRQNADPFPVNRPRRHFATPPAGWDD
jgi:hypothetical protein